MKKHLQSFQQKKIQPIIFCVLKQYAKVLCFSILIAYSTTATAQSTINYGGNGFLETPTDNGAVYGGISATLVGDSFTANTLTPGVDVNLGNIPTGLTPLIHVGGLNPWVEGMPPNTASWQDIAYGNGIFVAVGLANNSTEQLMTSTDGINWTTLNVFGADNCRAIVFGDGKFLTIPISGTNGYTSTDGINWTAFPLPATFISDIIYADGKFVAMRQFSPNIYTSLDGINWSVSNAPTLQSVGKIAYGNDTFVAVAGNGTTRVMRSIDGGINWTEQTPSTIQAWRGITFGNNTFVAISSDFGPNNIMTSPDGIEWTTRQVPGSSTFWSDIDFINGQFVAVALNGSVMTSPNGIDWTLHTGIPGHQVLSIEYGDGRYVAAGQFGNIMTTTTNRSEATLFLIGNAIANDCSSDNVSNITFNFNNSAFTSDNAASVINATGPANSNLGVDFLDTMSPVAICQDITLELDANGMASITATDVDDSSTDNCSTISLSIDITDFTCDDVGENQVTLTVTDASGNTSSCNATITVEDTITPTLTCPTNITVNNDPGQCNAVVTFAIPTATDNCAAVTITQTDGLASGSSFPVGTTTNTFVVTDVGGNTATCSFDVIVIGSEPPVAVCQDITMQLNENGIASITATDIDGGSTDDCGIGTIEIDITTFTCANIGSNAVILTVTDTNGNTDSCTAIVTVEDPFAPQFDCPSDIEVNNNPVLNGTVVNYSVPVSDNCPVPIGSIDGFTELGTYNGSVYYLSNSFFTAPNAFTDAIAQGGFVMTIDNAEENEFIRSAVIDALGNNSRFFIGYNDLVAEGTFEWQSGSSSTYTNWSPGEPNNAGGAEDYVEMFTNTGTWNDNGSSQFSRYILEFNESFGIEQSVVQTEGLPSGSLFPPGITTNTFEATDASGNTATCSFDITVIAELFDDIDIPNILDVIRWGDIAWGDYDNDGDLDILLTGQSGPERVSVSKIYRNDGNNVFTDIMANIIDLSATAVDWGDYDNDGDLDILIAGSTGFDPINGPQRHSKIYRNDGNDIFTDISASLFGLANGDVAWGDYDNDGDLDVLITGDNNFQSHSKIYRNDGNDTFIDILAPIQDVFESSVAWGDYDNDGDLDILLTGTSRGTATAHSIIYRNEGNETFIEVATPWLPNEARVSATWGDYDNDGDLDILFAGTNPTGTASTIYRNEGNDLFTDTQVSLPGVADSSATWGDYDNDGDLDILLTGRANIIGPIARVYRNEGNENFINTGVDLLGVHISYVTWGDYDNDGDLDILYTGTDGTNFGNGNGVTKLYRNNNVTSNTAPNAPTNVSVTDNGDATLDISWDVATDNETPSAGLSYNILIKEGTDIIKSAMADENNGYRKVVRLGNTMQNISYTFHLPLEYRCLASDFSIQVQAIDHSFAGSVFSSATTISIDNTNLPSVIYVDSASPGGNGLSWSTAYNDLQEAIDNVSPLCTSEIWVAQGTYKPIGETSPFVLPEGITVRGGFNGTENSPEERNCPGSLSVLSGDLNSDGIPNAGDAHTIVQIKYNNSTLDGFVIENSYADATDDTILPGRTGGGIYIRNDVGAQPENVQVENTIFRNNHVLGTGTVGVGAAVISFGINVSFFNCLFYDNFASNSGGALSPQTGSITIANCTFANNTATIEGGAIHIFDIAATITNSIFAENTAAQNPDINVSQGTNVALSYSLLDMSFPAVSPNGGTVTDDGNNLFNTDPLFIGGGNYALQSSSPAINTGNNAANTTLFDLARADRVFDTIIDMGAFEDQGGMEPVEITAICQNITVDLDLNGMASITAEQIDNGSFANCGAITLAIDTTEFTCADLGNNTVTLTVEDTLGNTGTCIATVTVRDTNIPDITLYDLEVTLDANGMATITADDVLRRNGVFALAKNPIGTPPVNLTFLDYNNTTDALALNTEYGNIFPDGSNVYAMDGNFLDGQIYAIASIDPSPDVRVLYEVNINGFGVSPLNQIISSTGNVRSQDMAFSVDGTLYVLFEDGIIEIYDLNTNTSIPFANVGGVSSIQGLTYDFDNNRLLCVQEANPVQLFEIALPSGTVSPLFNFSTDAGDGPCAAQAMEYVGNDKVLVGSTLTNGVLCDAIYTVDLNTQTATILVSPTGTINEIQDMAYPWYGDACGEYSVSIDTTQFNCANVGATNEVNLTFTDTAGNSSTSTVNIIVLENPTNPCSLLLSPKVYLQGAALNPNAGEETLMRDDLRSNDFIPTTSPYVDGLIADASVFTNTVGTDAIVDWVLVELRDETDPSIIIDQKSGLLQRDGDIVDVDGVSTFFFNQGDGNYYVAINHRNHLSIMTNSSLALSNTNTNIDFTDANNPITFGTNAQTIFDMPSGLLGMWTGDINNDGIVQYSGATPDAPNILSNVLNDSGNFLNLPTFQVNGYNVHDIDMNGMTQYSGASPDTPNILQNILEHPGNFLNLNTFNIIEQLPL